MKINRLILALLLLSSSAFAQGGGSGSIGGGGTPLISKFMGQASYIFSRFKNWRPGQKELLEATLKDTRVVAVQTLLNPNTQEPIPHQEKLIAWGSRHLIQLKLKQKNGDESWEEHTSNTNYFAHHLVHEIYRATGKMDDQGILLDDKYDITVAGLHLDLFEVVATAQAATCTYRFGRPTMGHGHVHPSAVDAMAILGYTYDENSPNQLTSSEENCRNGGLSLNPLNWTSAPWVIKCDRVLELLDVDGNIVSRGKALTKQLATRKYGSVGQSQSPPWGFNRANSRAVKNAILNFNVCK